MGKLTKIVGVAGVAAGAAYLSNSENRKELNTYLTKRLARKIHHPI